MKFEIKPEEPKLSPDEEEIKSIPVETLEVEAKKYEYHGEIYYLAKDGFAYNKNGDMINNSKRIFVVTEGKLIHKAA